MRSHHGRKPSSGSRRPRICQGQNQSPACQHSHVSSLPQAEVTVTAIQAYENGAIEALPWHREVLFVAVVCCGQLFTQAGVGQVLSITQTIALTWDLPESQTSWFLAGYSLTLGSFILFSGRLGDVFGYKTLFLAGMSWFSLWSLACGLAVYCSNPRRGPILFVLARVLQGIGPALVLPNALALLGAAYAPGSKRKTMAFAAFAATAPAGSVLASSLSALFATLAWWPYTFWSFSALLAASTVVAFLAIPQHSHHHIPAALPTHTAMDGATLVDPRPRTPRALFTQLDIPGAATGLLGLVLFNFAWNQAALVGWRTPYVCAAVVVGVACTAACVAIEARYAQQPLVPIRALGADVWVVLVVVGCGWSCFGIWIWYTWRFLLGARAAPPLLASAQLSPVVVVGVAAAVASSVLLHRLGPPLIMAAALAAFVAGSLLIATCPIQQSYWAQSFVAFLVTPWGMDMSFPAATLILSDAVPRQHQGVAASLVNTIVNYSIALGLGVAGTIELHFNNGGTTPADRLRGYRAALYLGVGLAALGLAISLAFLLKSRSGGGRG